MLNRNETDRTEKTCGNCGNPNCTPPSDFMIATGKIIGCTTWRPIQTKPDYIESCEDCIHYTEKSYVFGECELCKHEVACDAICTQFAERWTE